MFLSKRVGLDKFKFDHPRRNGLTLRGVVPLYSIGLKLVKLFHMNFIGYIKVYKDDSFWFIFL
jgi:hypothetical protein